MVSGIPTVEVYYISLQKDEKKGSKTQMARELLLTTIAAPAAGAAVALVKLNRLYKEGCCKVIRSEEELADYENANGNAWITDDKALGQRQYYIRHPKLKNRKLLIEAGDFQTYVEEEQKDELLDFIFSHCSPKSVVIDRVEEKACKSKADAAVEGMNLNAGIEFKGKQGNYYSFQSENGAPRRQPRESYLWLEPSLMRSIEALTPGASLTQSYERDFTFGLTAGEAKMLGLSLEGYKKYRYKIRIEC